MFKRNIGALGLALVVLVGLSNIGLADEGEEVIQGHSLKLYPDTVGSNDTDRNHRLSKDKLEKVKKHFAGQHEGDRYEPYEKESEKGYTLVFHRTINGKDQFITEVTIAERLPDPNLHPALGELKAQVMWGKHSEAEYTELEKKYRIITQGYYRTVKDDQGHSGSEDEIIYRKVKAQIHPKREKTQAEKDELATGTTLAKDIKKQMQALKAKGDFAGMMQLAQQSKMKTTNIEAGAKQDANMTQDTWDALVKCLKDTLAVAYWTKIMYSDAALPPRE
jgi:hypothetical protein